MIGARACTTDRRHEYRVKRDAAIQALPRGERQAARLAYICRSAAGYKIRQAVAVMAQQSRFRALKVPYIFSGAALERFYAASNVVRLRT